MKAWSAIVRRELIAYFSSPLAYIILTAFLFFQGMLFWAVLSSFMRPGQQAATSIELLGGFFGGNLFFWIFWIVAPLIPMRTVAEERRSGTIEVLLTSPVTEGQVIFGKFTAALLFYLVLWAPTVIYVFIVKSQAAVDWQAVAATYFGVLIIGCLYISLGVFTSTITKHQIIAGTLAFTGFVILFGVPLVGGFLVIPSTIPGTIFAHADLTTHMADYAKGIVDTRHVVYELSLTVLFLFLATKSLELAKWR